MGEVLVDGETIKYDDDYSFKDYTGRPCKGKLSGKIIYASCFSHEEPNSKVFPNNMTGATFVNCNLDNCFIPNGNNVIGGSQRKFKVQNDLRDWELDGSDKPTRVMGEKFYIQQGISVDPKDISTTKLKDIDEIKKVEAV
ncbi:hypothetical protein LCGC14_2783690 [marine sediment metagenome]|uniref:Uncharacterized protein n=1 Tax=marine sediment metagenome TaxID=412755 RepID=A0A0F8YSK6_9ZZZZ